MSGYDVIIGIDVGLSGGIAFFDTLSGEVLSLDAMPSEKVKTKSGRNKGIINLPRLKGILEIPKVHNESAIVILESVHAFPGQGVVAMATLLEQKGIIRGLASGLGYDEMLVEPKVWQKHFGLIPPKELKGKSASKTKTMRTAWLKETSLVKARNLFPEWSETKLELKTAHGLSDALLLGKFFLETK